MSAVDSIWTSETRDAKVRLCAIGGIAIGALVGVPVAAITAELAHRSELMKFSHAFELLWPACIVAGALGGMRVGWCGTVWKGGFDAAFMRSLPLILVVSGPLVATAGTSTFMVWEHGFVAKPRSNSEYEADRRASIKYSEACLAIACLVPAAAGLVLKVPLLCRPLLAIGLGFAGIVAHFATSFIVFIFIGSGLQD